MARSIGSGGERSVAQVGPLHADHPRVAREAVEQLAASHVDRVDDPRAARQQQVGEAAGRRAGVEAGTAARVDRKRVERRLQLLRGPRRPARPGSHGEHGVGGHQLARLEGARAGPGQLHLAGQQQRLGCGARRGQPTVDEELVEAEPGHAVRRR